MWTFFGPLRKGNGVGSSLLHIVCFLRPFALLKIFSFCYKKISTGMFKQCPTCVNIVNAFEIVTEMFGVFSRPRCIFSHILRLVGTG